MNRSSEVVSRSLLRQHYTRRQFLTYYLVMDGTGFFAAREVVSAAAAEHPEWDMDEEFTWDEWMAAEEGKAE